MNIPEPLDAIDVRKIRRWLNSVRDYCAWLDKRINTISKKPPVSGKTASSGGDKIYCAKVTAVTDANNYTCDIYASLDLTADPIETGKQVRVGFITDSLSVNDAFPVRVSSITGEDYESIQQIGLL